MSSWESDWVVYLSMAIKGVSTAPNMHISNSFGSEMKETVFGSPF